MLPSEEEIRSIVPPENITFFIEYVQFIISHKFDKKKTFEMERHHIFPRSLFPKYKKEKDNIANLTFKDHIYAHYLLYKALPKQQEAILSLNMMINRGKYNPFYDNDLLNDETELKNQLQSYEDFRKSVCETISKMNTGKKRTNEEKIKSSLFHKNKVVLKDKNNNIIYTTCDDERYKSGELVYYRTGTHHTEQTKKRMSENGIKDHIMVTDGKNIKYVKTMDECPIGYYKGAPSEISERQSKYFSGKTFIYNEITGERKRWDINTPLPDGFVKQRAKIGKFVGWDSINKEILKIYDIRTKTICSVKKDKFEPNFQLAYPSAATIKINGVKKLLDIQDTLILLLDGFYFYRLEDINEYLLEKYQILLPKKCRSSLYILATSYKDEILTHLYLARSIKTNINKIFQGHEGEKLNDIFPLNFIKLKDTVTDGSIKIYNSENLIRKIKNGD